MSVMPYGCSIDKPVCPCKEILLSSCIARTQLVINCTGFPSLPIIPATPLWIQSRLIKADGIYSYSDKNWKLTHSICFEEDRLWNCQISFRFFPWGRRPDSVLSEDWRVFTIEGITNLPKMKQRSDRKGFHFLNHKRANNSDNFWKTVCAKKAC